MLHYLCVSLCLDPGMGPEEHEVVPAGLHFLPQPGGGVRGGEGGVGRHQEHEEVPQLPGVCPLPQSGNCTF